MVRGEGGGGEVGHSKNVTDPAMSPRNTKLLKYYAFFSSFFFRCFERTDLGIANGVEQINNKNQ